MLNFAACCQCSRVHSSRGPTAMYGAHLDLQRAVIHDGWKLILYPATRVTRLYDVAQDPHEMTDVAADSQYAQTRKQLFQRLLALQREYEDKLDLKAVFPEL